METTPKNKPFSEYERQKAISIITKRLSVLEDKKKNFKTLKMKYLEWEEAAKEFNNSPNVFQMVTGSRLKKFWANNKFKLSQSLKYHRTPSGNGPPVPPTTNEDVQISTDFPSFMTITNALIDSDGVIKTISDDDDDESELHNNEKSSSKTNEDVDAPTMNDEASPTGSSFQQPSSSNNRFFNNISIEQMKIKLLQQEYDHNEQKFELWKELHNMEVEFRKIEYALRLNNIRLSK